MLQELESRVLEVYRLLDEAVAGFASRTGLACPQGCGHCCRSEQVEATVLECLPLAFELFRTGLAELLLKRLDKVGHDRRCVLFRTDHTATGQWGCTRYRHRAVVCRLFGFAGNRDRAGVPQLAMCRVMKEGRLTDAAPVVDDPHSPMPLFLDAGVRITTLHPGLGTRRLPINAAMLEALLKVGMFLDLTATDASGEADDHRQPPA